MFIVAGTLAGLLGVGGGIVIVPALVWIFRTHAEIPTASLMHIAIGTTLATIVITSTSSIITHHRRGAVLWSIVWQLGFLAPPAPHRQLPSGLGLSITGAVIGKVSALMGIGGGSLTLKNINIFI